MSLFGTTFPQVKINNLSTKDWSGNSKTVYSIIGASNHSAVERESDDYYATDPIALEKLLEFETFSNDIWEPAVGGGHLAEVLLSKGYNVRGSDIVDRGFQGTQILDFMAATEKDIDIPRDIITNPPYKFAKQFVEKSMELLEPDQKCAMFLKLTFLEGQDRLKMFQKYPPKYIYVFSKRMVCAMNGDFEHTNGSAVAYAWFVWEKGFQGEPKIRWIS